MLILYLYMFILGSVIGSFLGVVIERLPLKESIVSGRSHCNTCHRDLTAFELVPIFSFLIQRGKCRQCKTKLSWRYPLLELLTGLAFCFAFLAHGFSAQTITTCILAAILIIITFIDIDTMIIYDRFHVLILILAIIEFFVLNKSFTDVALGAAIVSLPLLLVAIITGGMGGGDIKLMIAAGALLGFQATLVAFIIAVLVGGSYGVYALLSKKQKGKDAIPFGPFLCLGIYVAALYGPQIITFYLKLSGLY